MKILATTCLIAAVYAQDDGNNSGNDDKKYTDSQVQSLSLMADQKMYGTLKWFTRFHPTKGDKTDVTDIHYHCMPTMEGGAGYTWADYNDKEIQCQIGTITTENQGNRADWCKMRIKVKTGDNKYEWAEKNDGKLNGWKGRGDNDKWNFEGEGTNDCMVNEAVTSLGKNDTVFMPTIAWMKGMVTGDGEDNELRFKTNITVAWSVKDKDMEKKGLTEGFYIDDPMNPVITGAKTLVASAVASAALIYSTL